MMTCNDDLSDDDDDDLSFVSAKSDRTVVDDCIDILNGQDTSSGLQQSNSLPANTTRSAN